MQRPNADTREGRALDALGYAAPPISERALRTLRPQFRTPNQPPVAAYRPSRRIGRKQYKGRPISYGGVREIHTETIKTQTTGGTKHNSGKLFRKRR